MQRLAFTSPLTERDGCDVATYAAPFIVLSDGDQPDSSNSGSASSTESTPASQST